MERSRDPDQGVPKGVRKEQNSLRHKDTTSFPQRETHVCIVSLTTKYTENIPTPPHSLTFRVFTFYQLQVSSSTCVESVNVKGKARLSRRGEGWDNGEVVGVGNCVGQTRSFPIVHGRGYTSLPHHPDLSLSPSDQTCKLPGPRFPSLPSNPCHKRRSSPVPENLGRGNSLRIPSGPR